MPVECIAASSQIVKMRVCWEALLASDHPIEIPRYLLGTAENGRYANRETALMFPIV